MSMNVGPARLLLSCAFFVATQVPACRPGASVGPPTLHTPAPGTAQWRVAASTDKQITAAACGDQRFCIVTHRNGFVVTRDGGRTWMPGSFGAAYSTFFGSSASCPTATRCVVVGSLQTSGQPTIALTTDGARTWQFQSLPFDGNNALNTVFCSGDTLCLTAGSVHDAKNQTLVYVSHDGGSHWQSVIIGPKVDGISAIACTSASSCWALGGTYANQTNPTSILESIDGGQTWTGVDVAAIDVEAGSLSCATNGRCMAAGDTPLRDPTIVVRDDATHSVTHQLASLGVFSVEHISCGTPLFCVAVGYGWNRNRVGAIIATYDGGKTWQLEASPAEVLEIFTVACQANMQCVAGGGTLHGYAVLVRKP